MRIKTLEIVNFKGIRHLKIDSEGKNVTITGQNGAGKTSIMYAWQFVLGENFKDINSYGTKEEAIVEVVFDTGLTLRREYAAWAKPQNNYFVDGNPVYIERYKLFLENLAAGKKDNIKIFSQLDYFAGAMDKKQRRAILMQMCKKFSPDDVIASTEELTPLKGKNIVQHEAEVKGEIVLVKKDLSGIPSVIEKLQELIRDSDVDVTKKAGIESYLRLQELELEKAKDEVESLQERIPKENLSIPAELQKIQEKIRRLEAEKGACLVRLEVLGKAVSSLTDNYKKVAKSKQGICPHCGQTMPMEKFLQTREKQLAEIAKEGQETNAVIDENKKQVETIMESLALYRKKEAELQAAQSDSQAVVHCQLLAQAHDSVLRLTEHVNTAKRQLADIKRIEDLQEKIAIEKAKEPELRAYLTQLKEQLNLIKLFDLQANKLIENDLNAKFKHVRFKMFSYTKTTGEIKPECEVLLDDKPYSAALSKGEQLKASLDCLKTSQEYFKVELPVFIDDYESYTDNSLILSELPNQIFRLKVEEGITELKVEVF